MPSFNDFVPGKNIKVLVKGEPATRKSSALATFPGTTKWFDIDHKIGSIWTPKQKGLYAPTKLDFEETTGWTDLEPKVQGLTKYCEWDNVIIDTLSTLVDRELLGFAQAGGKKIKNIPVNSMEDWFAEQTMIMKLLEYIDKINANVFLVCHVFTSEDSLGKTLRQLYTGGRKAAAKIPSKFDEVWHFQTESGFSSDDATKYICLFENSGTDFARTALGIPKKLDWTDKSFYKCISPYLNGEEGTLEQLRREQKEEETKSLSTF